MHEKNAVEMWRLVFSVSWASCATSILTHLGIFALVGGGAQYNTTVLL
jgi:hypothetical protein